MSTEKTDSIRFFVVTGRSGSGKTTLLGEIAQRAARAGIWCGGFLQPRGTTDHLRTDEYRLTHLTDQTTLILARRSPNSGFVFVHHAFEQAEQWLQEDAATAQLLIVDELGKLESEGGGHAPALEAVVTRRPAVTLLAGVRKGTLDGLRRRYAIARERILDLDTEKDKAELFTRNLVAALSSPVR